MPSIFKKAKTPEGSLKIGVSVIIVILLAAGGLRLAQWMNPPPAPLLLPQSENLVLVNTPAEISGYTQTPLIEPKKLFGSTLHIIGIYQSEQAWFTEGTIALVYVKNGFRFVEISVRPSTTLKTEQDKLSILKKETVVLAPSVEGIFARLRNNIYCKQPTSEMIGVCQITRALLFETNGTVVVISADGEHATDGELIEMARSIVDAEDPE